MRERKSGLPWRGILAGICLVVGLIVIGFTADSNDAGYRTVIQYPNGSLRVKLTPGWYLKWFGNTTVYNDVITYDFDRTTNGEGSTLDQQGIQVRYRDGGTGTVYGIVQYMLPADGETMISLHKTYRSNSGVANKLIKQVTEEAMNLTAGLMTSEDGYDTKRAVFTEMASDQIKNGKYKTTTDSIIVKDEVTGKSIKKIIPVIAYTDKSKATPIHLGSDLKTYGITLVGNVRLDKADFETSTLAQISEKRKATMAIITAKANAERAKQDAITAEELGKAKVMTARYEEEVVKERATVVAERMKEVAVIGANQRVEVAEQKQLEAEQMKLVAEQIKQEQILLGEGEAERKRLVMEADGQLALKLQTYENVMIAGWKYLGQNRWVPEIMMGASGGNGASANGGNNVQEFMDILKTKALKDLSLDMKIKGQTTPTTMASN